MQPSENVRTLIERAASQVGSKSKLARAMGVTPQKINSWISGDCTCMPDDRARLAGFAHEDAVQELVRATLEKNAGTLRGEQLMRVLGKSLPQIIAGIVFALLVGTSLISGSHDATGAVALFTFFLYSTMYILSQCLMTTQSRVVAYA